MVQGLVACYSPENSGVIRVIGKFINECMKRPYGANTAEILAVWAFALGDNHLVVSPIWALPSTTDKMSPVMNSRPFVPESRCTIIATPCDENRRQFKESNFTPLSGLRPIWVWSDNYIVVTEGWGVKRDVPGRFSTEVWKTLQVIFRLHPKSVERAPFILRMFFIRRSSRTNCLFAGIRRFIAHRKGTKSRPFRPH